MKMLWTRYLGPIHHPAIGVRIPEIFLEGILNSFKKNNVVGGLMLSFGRETAPEFVINAPPGKYEITRGHTGTSIKKYQTLAALKAKEKEVIVEIEADHLIIIGSSDRAVQRIAGVHLEKEISKEELENSINYNKRCIDEAIETGYVNSFTIDTSDLFNTAIDNLDEGQINKLFNEKVKDKSIINNYVGRDFSFKSSSGDELILIYNETDVKILELKFRKSLEISKIIYDYIQEKIDRPFGFEISLDETKELTQEKELHFYLNEWTKLGCKVGFIAPNIGFKKRSDYVGDITELKRKVEWLAAIAKKYNVLLSIHSGSGTNPYSGKGPNTYEALLEATNNSLKYKISGVYYELLLEILEKEKTGTPARTLFERIFDEVLKFLEEQIKRKTSLATSLLESQLRDYYNYKRETGQHYNSRADFFRYNSYLALNFRDESGERYFRNELVSLYNNDNELKSLIDKEVEELTDRLIHGLNFVNNSKLLGD
ncbi:MAG: tagaturonate epimerase family protein [Candidatus Helarchaeota archaeon]